jgi:hypothetical protein
MVGLARGLWLEDDGETRASRLREPLQRISDQFVRQSRSSPGCGDERLDAVTDEWHEGRVNRERIALILLIVSTIGFAVALVLVALYS